MNQRSLARLWGCSCFFGGIGVNISTHAQAEQPHARNSKTDSRIGFQFGACRNPTPYVVHQTDALSVFVTILAENFQFRGRFPYERARDATSISQTE